MLTKRRVAIITGGASGMGLATGGLFATAGAKVVLVDRADASTQAADIGATALRLDVSDESAVAAAFDSVAARHGRIDILVNNAGVFAEGAIDETTTEEWRRCYENNALGVLHGIKYSTPHMTPGAAIVNTASVAAVLGFPVRGLLGLEGRRRRHHAGGGARIRGSRDPGQLHLPGHG